MKTVITARYTSPDGDYTERRTSFDLHLPARVGELVGAGLLWELGIPPIPELAEISVEHRDGGCSALAHAQVECMSPETLTRDQALARAATLAAAAEINNEKLGNLSAWIVEHVGSDEFRPG